MKKSNKPTFVESDKWQKTDYVREKGCLNEGEYELQNHQTVRKIFFLSSSH